MKKLSVFLLLMFVFISCQKKNVIEITTENVPDNTVVEIKTREVGKETAIVIASGKVVDGKLTFDNTFVGLDEVFALVKASEEDEYKAFFIGEPGYIKIHFDMNNADNYNIGGTTNNDVLQKFQDEMRPAVAEIRSFSEKNKDRIMELTKNGDAEAEEYKKIMADYQALFAKTTEITNKFREEYRGQAIDLMMMLDGISSGEKTAEDYKIEFDGFSTELKSSNIGKKIEDFLVKLAEENEKALAVGDKLPEFKALTTDGKELTLTAFLEGKKLVLVDIWASWCGPCRQENPNIVKSYEAYKDKGFDIIGYSLDKKEDAWKKAIVADKLTWTQVSNLKQWEDPIVVDYGIKGVPASYLVNEQGVIIATDLRGKELSDKLEEILSK